MSDEPITLAERAWLDSFARVEAEFEAERATVLAVLRRSRERAQSAERRPPGECVAHSVNATAHVVAATARAESLTQTANAMITPIVTAVDVARAQMLRPPGHGVVFTWNMHPGYGRTNASAKGQHMTELAKLLGAIFSGGVTDISFSQSAASSRATLNVAISLPADISLDDVIANLQRLTGELSSAKPAPNTGRRRLLKLEEST